MSENAFVFPSVSGPDIVRLLDEVAEPQPDQWVAPGPLFVWMVNEAGGLYQDWEPEDVVNLEQAVGHRPTWGVQIQYRLSRRQGLVALARVLLHSGGVAVDDFLSTHAWTQEEIEADATVSGARFGEPPVRQG